MLLYLSLDFIIPFLANIFPNLETPKVPNPPSCFVIPCFTVSLTPSVNAREFSSYFIVLVILFMYSFEMTKVIPVRAPTAPLPRIFLWIAPSVAETDAIVANGTKKIFAKGTQIVITS